MPESNVETRRGGSRSRAKGDRAEREVVHLLQCRGIAAQRVPLSGAAGGRFGSDLVVRLLGVDRLAEVKCRADGFRTLYGWLEGCDLLILKADRREPLVVLPMALAVALAAAADASAST